MNAQFIEDIRFLASVPRSDDIISFGGGKGSIADVCVTHDEATEEMTRAAKAFVLENLEISDNTEK